MNILTKLFGRREETYLTVGDIYQRMGLDLNQWHNEERKAFPCEVYRK